MTRHKRENRKRFFWLLFGSPDRFLSTAAILSGGLSLVFAIYLYVNPYISYGYFLLRDISLVFMLVLIVVILALKYYKKNELVEEFRDLLSIQVISSHQLVDKFRDHFFSYIRYQLINKDNASDEDFDLVKRKYFNKVCHSVLTDTRMLFMSYFNARGLRIRDDLTVTVKLIVSSEEARVIKNRIGGVQVEREDFARVSQFIVTAYRDPYTWEKRLNRREVQQFIYRVGENTAFDEIINKRKDYFLSNDLRTLQAMGEYHNEHQDWEKLYNATLVVPIRYKYWNKNNDILNYGLLAVDSSNFMGYDLFDAEITYNMLAHSADMLAIMLGHIDILQLFQGNNKKGRHK